MYASRINWDNRPDGLRNSKTEVGQTVLPHRDCRIGGCVTPSMGLALPVQARLRGLSLALTCCTPARVGLRPSCLAGSSAFPARGILIMASGYPHPVGRIIARPNLSHQVTQSSGRRMAAAMSESERSPIRVIIVESRSESAIAAVLRELGFT